MESTGIMNGNYLQDKEGKIYCINIDHEGIEGIGVDHNQIEYIFELEPIPLTEDWFVKFGFELSNVGVRKDGCDLIDIGFMFHLDGYGENREIKYVHQLQNLYFALTQKELTSK